MSVKIFMLCIILMNIAFGQVLTLGDLGRPEPQTDKLEKLYGTSTQLPQTKDLPKLAQSDLPSALRGPSVRQRSPVETRPKYPILRDFQAKSECVCKGESEWKKFMNLGISHEVEFRFQARKVEINGQCYCKHFLLIRTACTYRQVCYKTFRYDENPPYYVCPVFHVVDVEQDLTYLATPKCQAMNWIQRIWNVIVGIILRNNFPVGSGGYCIWPPPAFNTLYVGVSGGHFLNWEWGASPWGPKQIWFC